MAGMPQETYVADRGQRADGELQLEDAIEAVPHEEPQLHEDRIPGPVEIVPDRQHRPPDYYGAVPY